MKNFVKIGVLVIYLVAMLPVLVFAQTTTQTARMYFTPSSGTVTANPNFTVDIGIDTGGSDSAGADVIVQFTPSQLQFVSGEYPDSTTFYPNNRVVYPIGADASGKIVMARVISTPSSGSPVYTNGTGTFARLTFKPLVAVGQTVNLNFVFTLGSTTDSNVAGNVGGVDILGSVTNATLTIAGGTPTAVLDHVDIAPTSATMLVNGTKSFTATAKDASGNAITSGVTYSWGVTDSGSLNATSGATIIYTAGATAGTAVITATATQGTIVKTASATIVVNLPSTGPEMYSWLGIAMSAFGMSGLSYLKLFAPKKEVESESESDSLME